VLQQIIITAGCRAQGVIFTYLAADAQTYTVQFQHQHYLLYTSQPRAVIHWLLKLEGGGFTFSFIGGCGGGTQTTRVRRFQTRSAGHNDVVWRITRFIFWCLFYGFVGSELAFFTSPLRGLSQKVAALVLCAFKFKCSAPAVPMRTCVLASPRRSGTADRVTTTAGATKKTAV
jgi:hypothetical protein